MLQHSLAVWAVDRSRRTTQLLRRLGLRRTAILPQRTTDKRAWGALTNPLAAAAPSTADNRNEPEWLPNHAAGFSVQPAALRQLVVRSPGSPLAASPPERVAERASDVF